MEPSLPEWLQAAAAILTMIAAFAAALIAWKVPELAARYAEKYRRETLAADEMRAFQTQVFRALMKGRAEMAAQDTRAAINLCEAAFPRDARVRSARRMFTKAASAKPFDGMAMAAAYFEIVEAVTAAIGLGEEIDKFDIESGYYPQALALLDEAALAEAAAKLADHARRDKPGAIDGGSF